MLRSPSSAVPLGSHWWSVRLRCSSATYVASVGRVSRGCFTSFSGPPTLEFLRFLALLPSILPTMPAAALMSALGKFRFIGSRPRLCSWARYCGGLRISLSDGGNPAFRLHPQGRALVPLSAEIRLPEHRAIGFLPLHLPAAFA